MRLRQKIGLLVVSIMFTAITCNAIQLVNNHDEIWWFFVIMEFVYAVLMAALYHQISRKNTL